MQVETLEASSSCVREPCCGIRVADRAIIIDGDPAPGSQLIDDSAAGEATNGISASVQSRMADAGMILTKMQA